MLLGKVARGVALEQLRSGAARAAAAAELARAARVAAAVPVVAVVAAVVVVVVAAETSDIGESSSAFISTPVERNGTGQPGAVSVPSGA